MSPALMSKGPIASDLNALLSELEESRVHLGLEHVRGLLAALDDPHKSHPAVLVAGTNGKGSTCAHLAAILSAAGLETGLYTSPHLESATERIRVDGLAIVPEALYRQLRRVVDAAAEADLERPTYFETMTAAAMLHFADAQVDVAVYEVGLGGRLDATNVVDPVLSVITEIALDHQQMLGDTLAAIAREKAGILRPGVPCCHWISDAEARAAVEAVAAELGSPIVDARLMHGPSTIAEQVESPVAETSEQVVIRGRELEVRAPARHRGVARQRNLSLALCAAETLAGRWPDEEGFRLEAATVERAFASCRWPGRWELVRRPDDGWLLLDGAHNPHGSRTLATSIADTRYGMLFGTLADKAVDTMLPALADRASSLVLTRPASPRAADPAWIAAWLAPDAIVEPDPAAALRAALDRVAPDELLVVCGSLYLVGEVRGLLRQWWGRPESAARIYGPFEG